MTTKSDAADALRRTMPGRCSVNARVGGWPTDAIESAGSRRPVTSCPAPGNGRSRPPIFSPAQVATAIGSRAETLAAASESANMALSCGTPTAIASPPAATGSADFITSLDVTARKPGLTP